MSEDNSHEDTRVRTNTRISRVIPRDILAREAELLLTKWPAYRFMTPAQATRLFQDEYVEAYKTYIRVNIDCEAAEQLKLLTKLDWLNQNSHLTQLWKARQFADELGMTYRAYLEFTFKFAAGRKRKKPPQPNQLGPNSKTDEAWFGMLQGYWTMDRIALERYRAEPMAQYALEHDRGLPAQELFREELVEFFKDADGRISDYVGRYVKSLRYLTVEHCSPLGEEALRRAVEALERDWDLDGYRPHVYDDLKPGELLQSCYGVPGAQDDARLCGACPDAASCSASAASVLARLRAETGSENPLEDHRKQKQRERTARCRARKKGEGPAKKKP